MLLRIRLLWQELTRCEYGECSFLLPVALSASYLLNFVHHILSFVMLTGMISSPTKGLIVNLVHSVKIQVGGVQGVCLHHALIGATIMMILLEEGRATTIHTVRDGRSHLHSVFNVGIDYSFYVIIHQYPLKLRLIDIGCCIKKY